MVDLEKKVKWVLLNQKWVREDAELKISPSFVGKVDSDSANVNWRQVRVG